MRSLRAVCLGLLFSGTNHYNVHRRIWHTVFPSFTFQRTYRSLSLYSSFCTFNSLCGSSNFKQVIEPHTLFVLLDTTGKRLHSLSPFHQRKLVNRSSVPFFFFATYLSSVWASVFAFISRLLCGSCSSSVGNDTYEKALHLLVSPVREVCYTDVKALIFQTYLTC